MVAGFARNTLFLPSVNQGRLSRIRLSDNSSDQFLQSRSILRTSASILHPFVFTLSSFSFVLRPFVSALTTPFLSSAPP